MYMVIPQVLLIIFYFVFICLDIADCMFWSQCLHCWNYRQGQSGKSIYYDSVFYLCVFILQDIPIFLLLLFSFSLSCILYLEVVFSNSVVSVATDSIFWGVHCYTTSPKYHIWWSCFICLDISDCDFWSHCLHRWNRR